MFLPFGCRYICRFFVFLWDMYKKISVRMLSEAHLTDFFPFWRRERDSNPRSLAAQRFSRPPQSTTLPSLLRRNALVALTAALRHWATAIPPLSSKPRASRMMFFRNRVQKYCFFLNCANFYALFLRISKFCSNFAAKFVQNAFTNTQIQDSPRNGDRSELRLHWQYHH